MNLALLAAAATGVQVGAAIVATRYVVAEVPPLTLALLRYAIGVATLLPFAWHALRNGRRWPQATHPRRDLAAMAALGIGQFAVLIALLKRATERGGDLRIARLCKKARMVFEITRFHRVFEIYDTLDEALRAAAR